MSVFTGRICFLPLWALIGMVACAPEPAPNQPTQGTPQRAVKIAVFGDLSDKEDLRGREVARGVQLAVQKYQEGDVQTPTTVLTVDTFADRQEPEALAQQLAEDSTIVAAVGIGAADDKQNDLRVLAQAGLPIIIPTPLNADPPAQGQFVFGVVPAGNAQAEAVTTYITQVSQAERVAVIHDGTRSNALLADQVVKGLGKANVVRFRVRQQRDVAPAASAVKSGKASVVFFAGQSSLAGKLRREVKRRIPQSDFIGSDQAHAAGFLQQAGGAAEGAVVVCTCVPADKVSEDFFKRYRKMYKSLPESFSAEAYDATRVLLDSLTEGKVKREEIASFIQSYDRPGLTKQLNFTSSGRPKNSAIWAYKVLNGKFVPDQEVR
ncbi:MAG: branched-chain amino acid ABC transporter substrate-binding protein [Actinomycetota bacterium]